MSININIDKVEDIKKLSDLLTKANLSEISLEIDDAKITLKREVASQLVAMPAPIAAAPAVTAAPVAAPTTSPAAAPSGSSAETIDSPLVGTFYSSPSPELPAFVKEGDTVTPSTVVCIIEAMKVMNEIKAEKAGVITKICNKDGDPIQFGQPLFEIK